MENEEEVTVNTFNIRETGPYLGQRIAGTSRDVVEAVLTKEYCFGDGITIRVIDIPARLDRITGKTFISGRDGRLLLRTVRRYVDVVRRQRARQITRLQHVPVRMRLHAMDAFREAA